MLFDMRHRTSVELVLMFVTFGCSTGEADRSQTARVDSLASGRVVVTNTGTPNWPSQTAWRLEEDLRIGTASNSGPAVEQFGSIASIAADSRGRIYVLDRMSHDIKVFRSDGTFSHTIGREGQGPGEFAFPNAAAVGTGDTIWVVDDGTARYSAFAPDGSFLTSYPRRIQGYLGSTSGGFLEDGRYVGWTPGFPDGREGARMLHYPLVYSRSFQHADTLPPLEHTSPMLPSGRWQQWYFTGSVVAAVDRRGGIWFANSREYRIYCIDLQGDTTLVFSLPVTAASVSDADRETVRNDLAGRPDLAAEFVAALPETKPIVQGVVPDNAGHLLVFVDVAGQTAGSVVDVFRVNGAYLGRMALPMPIPLSVRQQVPVAHATADHLYVVVHDGLDVPYVMRLKIVRGL